MQILGGGEERRDPSQGTDRRHTLPEPVTSSTKHWDFLKTDKETEAVDAYRETVEADKEAVATAWV